MNSGPDSTPEIVLAFRKCFAGFASPRRSESRVSGPAKTDFHFDAEKAASQIDPSWIPAYSASLGETVYIIGAADLTYLTLCLSATGKVIGAYDEQIVLFGNSIGEALENLMCKEQGQLPIIPFKQEIK